MKKGANNTYFGNIGEGISSLIKGLGLTFKHLFQARFKRKTIGVDDSEYFNQSIGIVTMEYPHEAIPIPDNGRYRLHNEIEDCIVCDLCAKICPVNCIEIEPIKSTEEIGKTSDGTTRRLYAGTFDIDMAKCCYCGLCTTVCPTECLTMTKTYDYSEFDIRNMVYHFTELTPEQAEAKKKEFEEKQKLKAKPEAAPKSAAIGETEVKDQADKPAEPVKKPAFKPVIKKPTVSEGEKPETAITSESKVEDQSEKTAEPKKPVFKPVIKKPTSSEGEKPEPAAPSEPEAKDQTEKPAPAKKPVFKPVIKKPNIPNQTEGDNDKKE